MISAEARMQAAITECASEWYSRHRDGGLSPQEIDAFLGWLRASPLHVREYLAVASLATKMPEAVVGLQADRQEMIDLAHEWLRTRGNVVTLHPHTPVSSMGEVQSTRYGGRQWHRIGVSIAASLLLIVGAVIAVGLQLGLDRPGVVGWSRAIEAPVDQRRTVRLRDGSVMHLDAGTRARVRYSNERRIIDLEHGRAMFSVASNVSRPFVVTAGTTEVLAVGTRFDVHRLGPRQAVIVTVVEGKVDVLDRGAGDNSENVTQTRPVRLNAGQQVQLARARLDEPRVEAVNVRQATAWLRHEMIFSERPLGEVAAELSRYGVPIVIDDPALREYRVNGVFDVYDTESFVAFLERLGRVERGNTGIRLHASDYASSERYTK